MRKSAHLRGQFAQFFFHLGGIKVGVSTFFTLGVDLKKFFTLGTMIQNFSKGEDKVEFSFISKSILIWLETFYNPLGTW